MNIAILVLINNVMLYIKFYVRLVLGVPSELKLKNFWTELEKKNILIIRNVRCYTLRSWI